VAAVGLTLIPARAGAAAPTAEDRERRTALLRTGADAAKAKDWKGCVDALREALALEDAARTAGDLGLCEEGAGRFGDAMNHLRRALAEATPDVAKKEPWKSYRAASDRLVSQVAFVVITVHPTDARVVLDGRPLGKADGQIIAMSYGVHTLVARKDGYEDASDTRRVTPSGVPNIQLTLKPKAKPEAKTPAPALLSGAPEAGATPSGSAGVASSAAAAAPSSTSAGSSTASRSFTTAAASPEDAPARAPLSCLPAWSPRGVLLPLSCAGAAAVVASGATALGFEVHARSMQRALEARQFEVSRCAAGEPGDGSRDCKEIAARFRQRDAAADVLVGAAAATGVLALSAALVTALESPGSRATVTVAASPSGGAIVVQGTW